MPSTMTTTLSALAVLAAAALPAGAATINCPVSAPIIVSGNDQIGSPFCVIGGTLEILSGGKLSQDTGSSTLYQGPSWWTNVGGTVANRGSIQNASIEFMNLGRLENLAGGRFDNRGQLFNGFELPGTLQQALVLNEGTFHNLAGAHFSSNAMVQSSGSIYNDGAITHTGPGVFSISGSFAGSGSFYSNGGVLEVLTGGQVAIANSGNQVGGKLEGGFWNVLAGAGNAALSIGSGGIHTIGQDTFVTLSGAGASFSQLAGLSTNQGVLTIAGRSQTLGAPFTNLGTVVAAEGGHVTVSGSTQLAGGVLSGGTWHVHAGSGSASLSIDSGPIHTLAAGTHVSLSGAGARFDQLALAQNNGRLDIGPGFVHTQSTNLVNAGLINIESRLINQAQFSNAAGGEIVNRGVLYNAAGASFISSGFIRNHGEVVNAGVMEISNSPMNNERGSVMRNLAGGLLRFTENTDIFHTTVWEEATLENAGRTELLGVPITSGLTINNLEGGSFVFGGATLRGGGPEGYVRINNAGEFLHSGNHSGSSAYDVENLGTGVFTNTGRIKPGELNNQGHFVNQGEVIDLGRGTVRNLSGGVLINESTIAVGRFVNEAGARLVNNGTIDTARLELSGELSGTGWARGRAAFEVASTAVVAPGNSIGTMRFESQDATINFDGTLEIEIDGAEHDVLWVSGRQSLRFGDNASLHFKLLDGPLLDHDMGFVLADVLEGFDADVELTIQGLATNIGWRVWESDERLYIRFFSTDDGGRLPLPGTPLLLALGLSALGMSALRRARVQRRH